MVFHRMTFATYCVLGSTAFLSLGATTDSSATEYGGGVDRLHGEVAADYSAKNGGRAVLVMMNGKIVFERYDNGFGPETATHLHSATKGFWGPVIAAMIEDGLIQSFGELASETLPEWKNHPRKSRITLRHLLTLSAGLVQDVVNLQGHDRPTLAPDLYRHSIGVWAIREPGAVFQYGPVCYYVLGEIIKRKLAKRKQTPLDYLKRRLLEPIGVEAGDWVHDASGNPHIPNGAHLTARDWAKFGQWLLQDGEWNGKQIVRRELLDELIKPSKSNPGHGLALWLNQPGGKGAVGVAGQRSEPGDKAGWIYRGGHRDLFAALGAGKCRMYVIPSLNMVALRQADRKGDRFDDNTFLSLLLTGESPQIAPGRPSGNDQSVDLILRRMDRNGDGRIAPEEAGPQLRRWFDRLDQDGDGTLAAPELRPILERRGRMRSDE
jgi:CubicO group peptidase (beta-lactamase class C family)